MNLVEERYILYLYDVLGGRIVKYFEERRKSHEEGVMVLQYYAY